MDFCKVKGLIDLLLVLLIFFYTYIFFSIIYNQNNMLLCQLICYENKLSTQLDYVVPLNIMTETKQNQVLEENEFL